MEFAFDEHQLEFRTQLRALADKECGPSDIRAAWESPFGWSQSRWESLAEMGVVGLTVPEPYGGLGLDEVDLVLLLEEAGRAGLPEPLLETTALAVPLLVDASGDRAEAAREEWLPRVASGETVATVGVCDAPGVPAAAGAHLMLLETSGSIHAVPADAVHQEPLTALDGSWRLARVRWDPSPATLLASGEESAHLLATTADRAALGAAAVLLGVTDRMIAMAAQYAQERRQFGRAIGSFQAVKHHLSNVLIGLEFSRPLVYRAAWSVARRTPDASLHASMAKAQASDAALSAARIALQVHGAIGYTWEHDLHLWMKRAWSLAAAWGDAPAHRARVLALAAAARSQALPA
ncbi:MAG TPA: acyl-CoA dehydrogenase family protein [Acidimicrobiales bacterium]|nr:acyl-CoA dehydrogenase family protein [Acidimicrobiales bacterium]